MAKTLIAKPICSFIEKGETYEEAYTKGCKRYASFIALKRYKNICLKCESVKEDPNAIKFILYASVEAVEEQKQFCKMCKEMHSSFFINEEYNCSSCKIRSYLSRVDQKLKIAKGFYSEKIFGKYK